MEGYKYEIITDTCSNLSEEEAKEFGIRLVGFPYTINGVAHTDNPETKTFTEKEAYEFLRKQADVKTSLINKYGIISFLEPYLEEGKDVIYICISGGISGTYENALMAKEELLEKYPERNIYMIDSLCGSYAQGLVVVKTALKRKEGADIHEAAAYAEVIRYHITHDFTIDDLFFLKKGGRLSNTAALFGSLIMIKPMLTLTHEGKLVAYSKVSGRKKSLNAILENFKKNIDKNDADFIGIVHGDCEEVAEGIKKEVEKLFPKARIFFNYLTPLVGAHTGPDTIGLMYSSSKGRI